MKKSLKDKFTLIFFSLLLGIFISIQFKQEIEPFNPVTLRSIQVTRNEIDRMDSEIEEMKELLKNKEDEIEKFENVTNEDDGGYELMIEELDKIKSVAGFERMEGTGIVIKMEDNQDSEINPLDVSDYIIHDIDVLNILNDLKVAGAEAISINGQRIMSVSEIKCGGPIIRVNGKSVGTPFVIKAIGDPKLLYAAVNAPGTYGYTQKNVYNKVLDITMEDKVIIPAYSGRFTFKYAKPVGEGD